MGMKYLISRLKPSLGGRERFEEMVDLTILLVCIFGSLMLIGLVPVGERTFADVVCEAISFASPVLRPVLLLATAWVLSGARIEEKAEAARVAGLEREVKRLRREVRHA